jgi:hypothetical protein
MTFCGRQDSVPVAYRSRHVHDLCADGSAVHACHHGLRCVLRCGCDSTALGVGSEPVEPIPPHGVAHRSIQRQRVLRISDGGTFGGRGGGTVLRMHLLGGSHPCFALLPLCRGTEFVAQIWYVLATSPAHVVLGGSRWQAVQVVNHPRVVDRVRPTLFVHPLREPLEPIVTANLGIHYRDLFGAVEFSAKIPVDAVSQCMVYIGVGQMRAEATLAVDV